MIFGVKINHVTETAEENLAQWVKQHNQVVRSLNEEAIAERVAAYNEGLRDGKKRARDDDANRRDKAKLVVMDEVSTVIDELVTQAPGYPSELEPGSIEFTAWKLATMNRIAHMLHKI